jgi:ribonuclease P protein component
VLPARNRMTRSAEFDLAVRHGVRAPQPSIVVHARRPGGGLPGDSPQIGLIVAKSVGGAVDRHRVARLIRHAARGVLAELDPADRIVIRALPASRTTPFPALEQQLLAGVRRAQHILDRSR